MVRHFLLFFTLWSTVLSNQTSDNLPSIQQIQSAVDSLKEFFAKNIKNLEPRVNDTNATIEESLEEKVAALRTSFFSVFDAIRTNNLIATDRNIHSDNVCTRDQLRNLPDVAYGTFLGSVKCHQFQHAIRCFEQLQIPENSNETMRIRKCCEGYETDDLLLSNCTKANPPALLKKVASDYGNTGKVPSKSMKSTFIIPKNSSENMIAVPGEQYVYDWFEGSIVYDKHGDPFLVSQKLSGTHRAETYLNCVNLNITDIETEEGVVHIADSPIMAAHQTVMDLLEEKFSEFAKALPESYKRLLRSSHGDTFTVFAVPDDKMRSYGKYFLKRVSAMATDFAQAHVFKPFICSYHFPTSIFTTPSGNEYSVKLSENGTIVGSSTLIEADITAANGVVHSIDRLLNEWNYRMWYERLKVYNPEFVKELLIQYPSDDAMTVFVPAKDSYKVVKSELPNYVIRQPVEDFNFNSTVVTDGNTKHFFGKFPQEPRWNVSTSGDEPLEKLKSLQLGCNKLEKIVLKAFNTYVYFLSQPLPATKQNVLEFLKDRPKLSDFAELWEHFINETTVPTGFTVFVPINDSLARNDVKKMDESSEDRLFFIRSHMILNPICDFTLKEGVDTKFETVNKEIIDLKSVNGTVHFKGEPTTEHHVLSDGVLFII